MPDSFHPHTLQVLEYSIIREMLAQRATSVPGQEAALALTPSTDATIINERLDTVSEICNLMSSNHSIPLRGIKDIREALDRVRIGGSAIDPETLLDVASTLQTSRLLNNFSKHLHREFPSPRIEALTDNMGIFQAIETEINRAIHVGGTVKDQASSVLTKVRREQHVIRDRTRDHLHRLIQSHSSQKALQDQVVTMRDGRYVVPVRADHRNQIKGVVHDHSASGATIFIEPMAVVDMNNELRELEAQELREVDRILSAITSMIRDEIEEIAFSFDLLGQLDFYYAAGLFASDLRASRPRMNETGRIELRNARHPLLVLRQDPESAPKDVVPLTFEIGGDKITMLITGPNMGGKTVAIKTVGLLTLMAQSGLHIPADDPSDLSIFAEVFADIGDEQSIQANLSTFSSHLRHVVTILEEADNRTLVLLDELGSGTDPTAGAALGMAALESLTERGSVTIATTHYGSLKKFAIRTDRVENGSMAFDVNTLGPTYRFRQGIPGGSYAVEIGQRLGVPEIILDRTVEIIGQDERKSDDLIAALDRERQAYEETRREMETRRTELDRLTIEYREKVESYRKKEKDLHSQTCKDAEELINNANATIERTVADLRAEQASRASIKRAKEKVASQRAELRKLIGEGPKEERPGPVASVQAGDTVWVESLNKEATVVQGPDSAGRVRVKAGNIELSARRSDLRSAEGGQTAKTDQPQPPKTTPTTVSVCAETQNPQQLDVRGHTAVEAMEAVDKYIDQSVVCGLSSVRILHGKGSGILRKEIGEFLQHHELVKSAHFAPQHEGGNGVTVVDIDD